jgi:pyrophosphatase PpaX
MSAAGNHPFAGVLFDLDGTLVDTLELILASYRHTMAEHLDEVPPDEVWLRTMGTPLTEQLREFARTPEEAESMLRTYIDHNEENHRRLVRPFPGMREAVHEIRDAGYPLGIVTSKLRRQAIRELENVGLDGVFGALVCADDVERPKPHPEPVHRAAAGLGLPAERLLLVGDSIYDLRAGRAAGTRTAAALWGPFRRDQLAAEEPDHWLEGLHDLRALLGLRAPDRDG